MRHSPRMIPLGGHSHLVVHNEVHCATDIKVGKGGQTKALCYNPLASERYVSMHQKIQDLHAHCRQSERDKTVVKLNGSDLVQN